MITADRREIVHRVEGRDLVGADERHIERSGDIFDHRHRQPPLRVRLRSDLPLCEVEQGHHRRTLAPGGVARDDGLRLFRSEEHTSELQSLMRISYAVFCLKTTKGTTNIKSRK